VAKITVLYGYEGLKRVEIPEAGAGDLVALSQEVLDGGLGPEESQPGTEGNAPGDRPLVGRNPR
jgi:hypothetical protein